MPGLPVMIMKSAWILVDAAAGVVIKNEVTQSDPHIETYETILTNMLRHNIYIYTHPVILF
jgi:hypothetical protein